MSDRLSIKVGLFGEILVDFVATTILDGITTNKVDIEARLGGAPINAAVVASQMSAEIDSYPICAVGNDWLGNLLIDQLRQFSVKMDMVQRLPGRFTSAAFYPISEEGEEMWSIYYRDADLHLKPTGDIIQLLGHLDGFGLGAPTLANRLTSSFLDNALAHLNETCVVGIDLNYRATMWAEADEYVQTIAEWLPKAKFIKCNQKEGELITGKIGDPNLILSTINIREDQIMFLTLGEKGSMIRYGSKIWNLPTRPITGHPVGAGDSYFSALLVGLALARKTAPHLDLLDQLPLIGRYANICGGIANLHPGACSSLVTEKYFEAYNATLKPFLE